MSTLLKLGCIAIYLLAILATLVAIPLGIVLQYLALILLVGHALEVLIALKRIRLYQGPLVDSIALTLLFGFLHWIPLSRRGAGDR